MLNAIILHPLRLNTGGLAHATVVGVDGDAVVVVVAAVVVVPVAVVVIVALIIVLMVMVVMVAMVIMMMLRVLLLAVSGRHPSCPAGFAAAETECPRIRAARIVPEQNSQRGRERKIARHGNTD